MMLSTSANALMLRATSGCPGAYSVHGAKRRSQAPDHLVDESGIAAWRSCAFLLSLRRRIGAAARRSARRGRPFFLASSRTAARPGDPMRPSARPRRAAGLLYVSAPTIRRGRGPSRSVCNRLRVRAERAERLHDLRVDLDERTARIRCVRT